MHKKIFVYLLCIGGFVLLDFILFNQMINSRRSTTAVYSWDTVQVENPDDTVSTLISLDIDDIYQYAPEAYLNDPVYLDNIIASIQKTEQANKGVYLINGEPEWAMDPDARELIQYINTVDELNQSLPKDQQIKGLVAAMQSLEYSRAFMGSRIFSDAFNGNLNVSGWTWLYAYIGITWRIKSPIIIGMLRMQAVGRKRLLL